MNVLLMKDINKLNMIYKSVLKYTTNLEDISDINMDTSPFSSQEKCPRLSKAVHRLSTFLNSVQTGE